MKKTIILALALPLFVSCNIYAPFRGGSDQESILEEAQRLLHGGDFAGAIAEYNKLGAGELKEEKLCLAYLAKGGVTLAALLNIVTENSATMMGDLAQSLVPWTTEKAEALATAKTHCVTNYPAVATSTGTVALLNALSNFSDCAIRIAKADVYWGTNNADTTCNTAADHNDGLIRQEDIGPSDGNIEGGSNGMCAADVTICATNLADVDSSALNGASLGDIAGATDLIPNDAKSGVTTTARAGIYTAISSR